jgi:hypothetical protein
MAVTVTPDTFSFVAFDAATIRTLTESIVAMLGIDRPVHVEVDETTPLARVAITIGDTITLHIESGALEDSQRPRSFGETTASVTIARALLKAHDRVSGGFGEAPADDELSLRQVSAWNTYAAGRMARLGVPIAMPRMRYDFRNRHGFTDEVDAAFDRVWESATLTWGELESISSGLASVAAS